MKRLFIIAFFFGFISQSMGQFSQQERDSIYRLSVKDHQLMLQKLQIEFLRPGPSGNPNDPNAANADESKVKDYSLPELLISKGGSKVTSVSAWEKRKQEIKEYFNAEVYGHIPENIPAVNWKVISQKDSVIGKYEVQINKLLGVVDNSAYPEIDVEIQMTLTLPKNTEKKIPLVLKFDWNFPAGFNPNADQENPWQQQLLAQNWGYASLIPTSYQADNGAGLREGIIGLVNKGEPRKLDDWGTLRAWAWGASRAMDYFEKHPEINAKHVAIEGLSRYGKAAMVAMAYEDRFAVGFIGSAGAGGTKILRRNFGEQLENLISSSQYHWFTPNFIKYGGPLKTKDLAVDAHHLIALAAPRPIFISSGDPKVEGNWIDARGMFLAGVHASPAYEIYEEKGLSKTEFPEVGEFLSEGKIVFRIHKGGHTEVPNWPFFIEFAKFYFK
ncbi:glucuronyl esterase domain-containing protein [Zunongwangia endophytica]|uniref:Acetylxylan esterase n=1 Tax=Zunongwangia endophytica TaxID=1808945 RepID=A0ABV8H1Q4_9FLAO|nr:acetylxylan esterase [Zunongwangia endophytica]MDN3594423.1 acetylxylan esterase [Zunongwangia endophytica]